MSDESFNAATQYLIWALEEVSRQGHLRAARLTRDAVDALRSAPAEAPCRYSQEAKRFRDKADEAEQMAGVAETPLRRDTLLNIAATYRRTAEQMDLSSPRSKDCSLIRQF